MSTFRSRPPLAAFKLFAAALSLAVVLLFTASVIMTSSSSDVVSSTLDIGYSFDSKGVGTVRRSVLALKSDPLKPRFDQIRKQADDHRSLALAYSAYARKLKLENSKLVRVFADLSRSYMDLLGKPDYKALFDSDGERIDEGVLRQFEKEVKERIKVTRHWLKFEPFVIRVY